MTDNRALADLMAEGGKAAMHIDALLFMIEEAAWQTCNKAMAGRTYDMEDAERADALHTVAQMARRDFEKIRDALSEGGQFITVRVLND